MIRAILLEDSPCVVQEGFVLDAHLALGHNRDRRCLPRTQRGRVVLHLLPDRKPRQPARSAPSSASA